MGAMGTANLRGWGFGEMVEVRRVWETEESLRGLRSSVVTGETVGRQDGGIL